MARPMPWVLLTAPLEKRKAKVFFSFPPFLLVLLLVMYPNNDRKNAAPLPLDLLLQVQGMVQQLDV
jgi:hypothetical protein